MLPASASTLATSATAVTNITAKQYDKIAQGRAAHPGILFLRSFLYAESVRQAAGGARTWSGHNLEALEFGPDVKSCRTPSAFSRSLNGHVPGCAARPWAILLNRFAVRRSKRPRQIEICRQTRLNPAGWTDQVMR
jgi:hypothetical protein